MNEEQEQQQQNQHIVPAVLDQPNECAVCGTDKLCETCLPTEGCEDCNGYVYMCCYDRFCWICQDIPHSCALGDIPNYN